MEVNAQIHVGTEQHSIQREWQTHRNTPSRFEESRGGQCGGREGLDSEMGVRWLHRACTELSCRSCISLYDEEPLEALKR